MQSSATNQRAAISDEQLEKILIEVAHLRKTKALNEEEKQALKEQIKGYQDLLVIERERIASLKAALDERKTVNSLDEKRVALFEESLKDFQKQVERLTKERDRARGLLKYVAGAALAVGAALGFMLGNK